MKAFIVSLLLAVGLAAAGGYVLENYLSTRAEVAFASPATRIEAHATPDARNFSGGQEK